VPRWRNNPKPAPAYNSSTILRQVQTLNQLVTVKYVLEKVVVVEDVKWYGENRILLIAHGIVKAGVDLQQLSPKDVRVEPKKITVKVPTAIITDVYLDDQKTEVIERTTGLLRNYDKSLEQTARRMAIDDLRLAARRNGIIVEANDRARLQLIHLFNMLGFTTVDFRESKD
jgi:hypothetical protein